uniref:guanine nucleotide exchange factor MSS4-like isoform X2 n=1 Tax=Oncorhynchus gorbuscha TaxID=8017 RepID=UPI001EAEFA69|nr:guanine nucleotide exchange factor MSS4-like isoform X2 [Oncorhynchus gorbuscha]
MDNQEQCSPTEGCVDLSTLVSGVGKNIKSVLCQRCGSKVLCPGMAVFTEKELFLPSMRKKTTITQSEGSVDGDTLTTHCYCHQTPEDPMRSPQSMLIMDSSF